MDAKLIGAVDLPVVFVKALPSLQLNRAQHPSPRRRLRGEAQWKSMKKNQQRQADAERGQRNEEVTVSERGAGVMEKCHIETQ
jgi:hypothetical protein